MLLSCFMHPKCVQVASIKQDRKVSFCDPGAKLYQRTCPFWNKILNQASLQQRPFSQVLVFISNKENNCVSALSFVIYCCQLHGYKIINSLQSILSLREEKV